VTRIDEETLLAITQRWAPTLVMYARQWCPSPEDAVQEALIELFKEPDVPLNPVGWLFRVARFRAQNQARAQRRREHHEQVAAEGRVTWFESSKGASTQIEGSELTSALATLESLDREVVIARIWGELGWQEISELVDRPISTLHRRYTQALQQIKDCLTVTNSPSGEKNERIKKTRS
jgi:RNA polymerase sigma-70 factor (ECF subfamily)